VGALGVYESFHEGWCFNSLSQNLTLAFKYMGIMLVSMALSVIALRRPGLPSRQNLWPGFPIDAGPPKINKPEELLTNCP
jgi:hypothetical protein